MNYYALNLYIYLHIRELAKMIPNLANSGPDEEDTQQNDVKVDEEEGFAKRRETGNTNCKNLINNVDTNAIKITRSSRKSEILKRL